MISRILYFSEPRGVATSTVSPFLWPMIALPTGDSFESFSSAGIRLGGADDAVLDGLLRVDVAQAHVRADGHDVLRDLPLLDHAGGREPLLELRDPRLEHRLLVLRGVVLGVLGDVAELAGDLDPLGDLAPTLGREILDLALELLYSPLL